MTKSIEIESLSQGFALFFGAQDHHPASIREDGKVSAGI